MLLKLARLSLGSRRTTVLLTLASLSLGIALLLGIDHLRHQAKDSFRQTLSGTDLIVGPRGGQTNLLLYSVFQMGQPVTSLSPSAYQALAEHPMVEWAVPMALGDSVRGFPVFATHRSYFQHYRYGQRQALAFAQGRAFTTTSDTEVVLGARAASELKLGLGDALIVAHGSAGVSFTHHDDHPMTVVGILEPTGTPADRRVHTTLLAMANLHGDEAHPHDHDHDHDHQHEAEPVPSDVNAVLLGLKARPMVFALQRELNESRTEPMTALLPGVALTELWQLLAVAENLLYVISFLVLLATLTGMMTMLLASMEERRRELAVLRAIGAGGGTLFCLIELEVVLITVLSLVAGTLFLTAGLAIAQPWLASQFGLFIGINPINAQSLSLMGGILGLAVLMGLVPAFAAYRRGLVQGLSAG